MGKPNFIDGFKRDAVAPITERGYPVAEVSQRLGVSAHSLYAVQHATVIDARHPSWLVGQKRLDHAPLEVGKIISAHAKPEPHLPYSGKLNMLGIWGEAATTT